MHTPSGDRMNFPVRVGCFRVPVDKSLNVEGNRTVGGVLGYCTVVTDSRDWSAVALGHPVLIELYMEIAACSAYGENVPYTVTEGASTVAAPSVYRVVTVSAVIAIHVS